MKGHLAGAHGSASHNHLSQLQRDQQERDRAGAHLTHGYSNPGFGPELEFQGSGGDSTLDAADIFSEPHASPQERREALAAPDAPAAKHCEANGYCAGVNEACTCYCPDCIASRLLASAVEKDMPDAVLTTYDNTGRPVKHGWTAPVDVERDGIGWYVSDTHARRAIGYLTGSVPELRNVEVPRLAGAWGEALAQTIDVRERSPIGPESAPTEAEHMDADWLRQAANQGWENYHAVAVAHNEPDHKRNVHSFRGCPAATCKWGTQVLAPTVTGAEPEMAGMTPGDGVVYPGDPDHSRSYPPQADDLYPGIVERYLNLGKAPTYDETVWMFQEMQRLRDAEARAAGSATGDLTLVERLVAHLTATISTYHVTMTAHHKLSMSWEDCDFPLCKEARELIVSATSQPAAGGDDGR